MGNTIPTLPYIQIPEVQIPGYDIIRSDRNRYVGGVATYIGTVIPYIIRKDLLQDTLELLSVEVRKPKSKPVLISTWYRPSSAKIKLFQKFENFLKLIDNEDKDIIITRDLNCNHLFSTIQTTLLLSRVSRNRIAALCK